MAKRISVKRLASMPKRVLARRFYTPREGVRWYTSLRRLRGGRTTFTELLSLAEELSAIYNATPLRSILSDLRRHRVSYEGPDWVRRASDRRPTTRKRWPGKHGKGYHGPN